MSTRTPIGSERSAQPGPLGHPSLPVPAIDTVEIYDHTNKRVTVCAEKSAELGRSLVSKACLERLGRRQRPVSNRGQISINGYLMELKGIADLSMVVNKKYPYLVDFDVVMNLWVDIILGKKDCGKVDIKRCRELLPYEKVQKTEEEIEKQAAKDKKAEEERRRIATAQLEAKLQKIKDIAKGTSGKEGEGSGPGV